VTDWIGSLRLSERSAHRVVLRLTRTTRMYGSLIAALGAAVAFALWPVSPWLGAVPLALAAFGATLVSIDRRLTFDREAGVLRLETRTLGFTTCQEVPLFHIRAVCVVAQPGIERVLGGAGGRYVAFVERRVGEPIYLDEARRCARLMRMAEAIAEVADVRLEYDAGGAA
jgi:hypothetical protein